MPEPRFTPSARSWTPPEAIHRRAGDRRILDDAGVLELSDDGATQDHKFSLVQVDGQWRIDRYLTQILDARSSSLFNLRPCTFTSDI